MGKLKLYNLESEWLNDKPTHDDSTVSYVLDSKEAKFQENGGYFKAIYNVTSTVNKTLLLGNSNNLSKIASMFIDGEELDQPVSAYTFTSLGLHHVTCVMKKRIIGSYAFSGCTNLWYIDLHMLKTPNDADNMFYQCSSLTSIDLGDFGSNGLVKMNNMFAWCGSLTSIDVSKVNTTKTKHMEFMFYQCSSLTSIDLSTWDTSNVEGVVQYLL